MKHTAFKWLRSVPRRSLLAASVLLLAAGCSTSGMSFNSSALPSLQPGVTTFDEIQNALGAEPVAVYRDAAGPFMARWAFSTTVITDALYSRRELWLAFDAEGHYRRVVKAINVSQPNEVPAQMSVNARPAYPTQQSQNLSQAVSNDTLGGPLGHVGTQAVSSPTAVFPVR